MSPTTLQGKKRLIVLRVMQTDEGTWDIDIFPAHSMGVNAVSWAPSVVPGSLIQLPSHGGAANGTANGASSAVKRLVTAGCDNVAKIWVYVDCFCLCDMTSHLR